MVPMFLLPVRNAPRRVFGVCFLATGNLSETPLGNHPSQLGKWMEGADIVAKKEVTEYHESNIGYHVK